VLKHLEQLRASVGLECSPGVFVESQRIARPGCPADLDHDPGDLVTAVLRTRAVRLDVGAMDDAGPD
jgi:hypothetical protein